MLFAHSGSNEDFFREVARGAYPNLATEHKFGHNPSIATTLVDLWDEGGLYSYLSAATLLNISSSSVNDTSAGTGARVITIEGLDGDYNEISESVILNGQTGVSTVNTYLRVHRKIVTSAGATGENEGDLYAGTGAIAVGIPANVYSKIIIGKNQTLMAQYTVPAGKIGFLYGWFSTCDTQREVEFELRERPFGEVFQVRDDIHFFQNSVVVPHVIPRIVPEKSDITLRSKVVTGTSRASGFFDLIVETL